MFPSYSIVSIILVFLSNLHTIILTTKTVFPLSLVSSSLWSTDHFPACESTRDKFLSFITRQKVGVTSTFVSLHTHTARKTVCGPETMSVLSCYYHSCSIATHTFHFTLLTFYTYMFIPSELHTYLSQSF